MTKYAVIYTPWEHQPRIYSTHRSAAAAQASAEKTTQEFQRANRGSYGPTWKPAQSEDGKMWEIVSDDPLADYSDPDFAAEIIELA